MPENTDNYILSGLNESQIEAVTFGDGPLLVVAGAGSGKTRVITHRIAYLIERGAAPEEILGITFTNKAAKEMERRVGEMAGEGVMLRTFHSFCALVLRRQIHHLGLDSSFSIYDRSDSLKVVRRVCKQFELDPEQYKPADMLNRISAHKDGVEPPEIAAEKAVSEWDEQAARVYAKYELTLTDSNALDFDDLLVKTVLLFNKHPEVLARYQGQYKYLLVDEYQDTNYVQHLIAKALQGRHHNITAVGDPDQTIYTWRGARMENIMRFQEEFPGARVIKLERNYRSTANILNAASYSVAHNINRHEKVLYTQSGSGSPVEVVGHSGAAQEAEWVAKTINKHVQRTESFPSIGILYRTKYQSGEFEAALSKHGVPYQVVDTTGLFERKVVKDIAAYLHLVVNPKDNVALQRIINVPTRGIGAKTLDRVTKVAEATGMPIMPAILDGAHQQELPPRARKAVDNFVALYNHLSEECFNASSVRGAVERVINETDYLASIKADEREESRELLDYFLGFAEQYQEQEPEGDLTGFMELSVLASDVDAWEPDTGSVSLLTLHSAKGLEFDMVFLVGVEDRILPHSRALEDRDVMGESEAMEEERRLFHVGMTRARKTLYISYANERMIRGQYEYTGESPFLQELPSDGVSWEKGPRAGGFSLTSAKGRWSRKSSGVSRSKKKKSPKLKKAKIKKRAPEKHAANNPEDADLQPGKKIQHDKYGEGTLVSINRAGEKKLLKIDFPEYGVLTILE